MDEKKFLERKIFLKRQLIQIVKSEIDEIETKLRILKKRKKAGNQ